MANISHTISSFCRRAFYETNTRLFTVINDLLSLVIIFSLLAIVFESVPKFSHYNQLFLIIEYVAVFIFSVEYICRIIGSQKKPSYIFSFFGFIDLISILPTYLLIANLTPVKSARALRILRFLRIMRLAKVARLEHLERPSRDDTAAIIRINLQIYFTALIFIVLILGSLAYIFEYNNPHFGNIPISMLWVFESLLGGSISTIVPETYPGIIIFMIARFFSFVLLGFIVHIVGNFISHFLLGKRVSRAVDGQL